MNLILFSPQELAADSTLTLTDQRHAHCVATLRAKLEDKLRVGQIDGQMGYGNVVHTDENSTILEINLNESPPPKRPLTMILALPRPKVVRRIFRTVAELGVSELHLINSYKVEKSYWQSPALTDSAVKAALLDGLQQARDTMVPEVKFHRLFKPFVEDLLPGIAADSKKLIAHPETGSACPHGLNKPITLAIGPEGGFIPYEVEKFLLAGFEAVHLGPRILKVENAITALTSKLYDS